MEQRPISFPRLLTLAILTTILPSCCTNAQPRFWKVRDTTVKNAPIAYTVDTAAVPTTSLVPRDIRYVDSTGNYVTLQSPKMISQISGDQWTQATSGATYSLNYCPHRKACWAKTKAR